MPETIKLVSPTFSHILEVNIEIGQFPDGDSHVRVPQIADCKGKDVIIFHRLYPKQNTGLVTLLFILDSLKIEGAKNITVVAPYLPYARQDKKKINGEVQSAFVICNLLKRAGCTKLVTFDCHFLNKEGPAVFGELDIENISMGKSLVELAARQSFQGESFEVISPDAGANYLASEHGGKSYKKVRKDYDGEKIDYRDVDTMEGDFDVKGKNILLLDDMISTGNTMVRALEKLTQGGAKKIACAATHGLFLFNCINKMRKYTQNIYSTDSIENEYGKVSIKDKLVNIK